jgi:hypothetical protein
VFCSLPPPLGRNLNEEENCHATVIRSTENKPT